MHYTGTVGDYAELSFTGIRFVVTMQRNTNRGLTQVYVDNVPVGTINANGALLWQWSWASPELTPGDHKVRFVFTGGNSFMDIDAIQIE
jgi:hypothetical protein